jgi:hypothetical protein
MGKSLEAVSAGALREVPRLHYPRGCTSRAQLALAVLGAPCDPPLVVNRVLTITGVEQPFITIGRDALQLSIMAGTRKFDEFRAFWAGKVLFSVGI